MLLKYPLETWSIKPAAGESLRGANTPATAQALRCLSKLPSFMLNSNFRSFQLKIFQ